MFDTAAPTLDGIHHLKFAVSDLPTALDFYRRALGARRLPALDHRSDSGDELYAYICDVPGLGAPLELRLNPDQAARHRHFDPITIAVDDRAALTAWAGHLDRAGIARSGVIVSIQGWLIAFDDPDGNRLRLCTRETHGPELRPAETDPWITS